jgi:hypothetical protein
MWKRRNISIINRDRSETSRPMNAGPTSVVKAALVVWQATCPHPSPQPSTPASVQTRTNRESTEVKLIPANAVGAAPMSNGTRMRCNSSREIFITAPH